jgi:hypothetical protein
MGSNILAAVNPVEGNQEKELPPLACSGMESPRQIETSAPALAVGSGKTFTSMSSVPVHPEELVIVTVYVVGFCGRAIGSNILTALKPKGGNQEKELPPLA